MATMILGFFLILVVMLLLDGLWLGWLAKSFYQRKMTRAIVFEVRWWAAVLFYLLHTVGIVFFVVHAPGAVLRLDQVLVRGALFGLFTYGTYDLTNLATIRGWSLRLTAVDMVWGCFVTMASGVGGWLVFS